MLWPFFQEPSKGKEVENAGMLVDDSEGILLIIDIMIDLFDDILLYFLSEITLILLSIENESVRYGGLSIIEDVELLDVGIVAVEDFFHFLVKSRVIAADELFVAIVCI